MYPLGTSPVVIWTIRNGQKKLFVGETSSLSDLVVRKARVHEIAPSQSKNAFFHIEFTFSGLGRFAGKFALAALRGLTLVGSGLEQPCACPLWVVSGRA